MRQDQAKQQTDAAGQSVSPEIFRAYDIRGIVDEQLTEDAISQISRAIAAEARDLGIAHLLVGFDARLSSPRFSKALIEGLLAAGCDVTSIGRVPTPLLYFATHTTGVDSGVMLTASHNPSHYNGLKIVFRRSCLFDNQIQDIRQRLGRESGPVARGTLTEQSVTTEYLDVICSHVQLKRKLKLVIDCGNAVPGEIAPRLFERLGCEVIPLFCELDGSFPNHQPDPTIEENLAQLSACVIEQGADLGLAFDGDGDRMGLVTDRGEAIPADRLLMLLARQILPDYPGASLVYDVKCSRDLARLAAELGANPVMHNSGHSKMKHKMQETDAPLGGEFAAHFFIKDRWFGFDDGLYTAARLVEILSALPHSASEEFQRSQDSVATPELKLPIAEARKFDFMAELIERADFADGELIKIDGLRVEFADGWGLIRASNTSPALSLRFEAKDDAALERICGRFRSLIEQIDPSLNITF